MFDEFEHHSESIMLAGVNYMRAEGKGTVRFTIDGNDITLVNVLFVPVLQWNFVSVSKAVEFGQTVVFDKDFVEIKTKHGGVTLRDLFIFEAMKWHFR